MTVRWIISERGTCQVHGCAKESTLITFPALRNQDDCQAHDIGTRNLAIARMCKRIDPDHVPCFYEKGYRNAELGNCTDARKKTLITFLAFRREDDGQVDDFGTLNLATARMRKRNDPEHVPCFKETG